MSKKYIGITIGPIFDTILEASSPAAMWFSSFLFSDITRRLCDAIVREERFEDVEIYSPYYSEEVQIYADGVGKYHDRILFSAEVKDEAEEILHQIIRRVKQETSVYFEEMSRFEPHEVKMFMQEYLQIHFIVKDQIEKENIILEFSEFLSALEYIKTFPVYNSGNPIVDMMLGYEEGKNENIKQSKLYRDVRDKKQLEQGGRIRSIEQIASVKGTEKRKTSKYFAVVNADGDGMGKALEHIPNEQLTAFSKQLFCHASKAAEKIKEFGGMTIYAGGDDLLFLAPIVGRDGQTIFALCDDLRREFHQIMTDACAPVPTLSFGISVQYYKFPLYEAMNVSREMLEASKNGEYNKNATSIHVQKHSGQSIKFYIPNGNLEKLNELLEIQNEKGNTDRVLHSVIYSVEEYKSLYKQMVSHYWNGASDEKKSFLEIWERIFDNAGQREYQEYIQKIAGFFYDECVKKDQELVKMLISTDGEDSMIRNEEHTVHSLSTLLRLKKFFVEEGGLA